MSKSIEELKKAAEKAQADLQKALDSEREKELEMIKTSVNLFGFTAEELGFRTEKKTVGGKKIRKPKYKNPTSDEAWAGVGRTPRWVAAHVANGGKLEDLLIK